MQPTKAIAIVTLTLSFFLPATSGEAQLQHISVRPLASNVLVPQSRGRAFAPQRQTAIEITKIDVAIDIVETMATTTVEIRLENKTHRRQEAELIVPVPDGAVVRGFAYDGPHGQITAKVLPRDEARRIYESLVAKIRDPALVEFVGYNLIRSSVFPVEAHGKQKVRLTYEHLLEVDGQRVDYVLPRTESLRYAVPWHVKARIRAKRPISTVYSASHRLDIKRRSEKELTVEIATEACKEPGPFRLSYLLQEDGVTASMFAYPDKKVGGGYFLLLAGLPATMPQGDAGAGIQREVTLVIDRSGSMRDEKIEQVKEAALQILAGLKDGEAFNVIIYNNTVQQFSEKPLIKSSKTAKAARAYIEGITATGGTNIHDALAAALSQPASGRMLPIVLFLTDGLPTVGQTSELAIGRLVTASNPHRRRVFTFGVGFDVNAPCWRRSPPNREPARNSSCPRRTWRSRWARFFGNWPAPCWPIPSCASWTPRATPPSGGRATSSPRSCPTCSKATASSCWASTSAPSRLRSSFAATISGRSVPSGSGFDSTRPAGRTDLCRDCGPAARSPS